MKKGYINTVMQSRHCGRGPAIQAVNKGKTIINRLDPGSMSGMTTKKAFTLVELLVVVLIIGVLSAIAIPMYQGAVDKSHWSTMLPGAKAIKDAEEAIKMTNGAYTDNMANLDVTMNNSDLTFALLTPNNTADPNVIRVTNSKLANVRLASYLDDSPMFAGQLHCEAKTGDERAERLCGKLLMGQDLTSADGYTSYLLDQTVTKDICNDAQGSWSSSKTKCYRTTANRCEALGMPAISGKDQCGYIRESNKAVGPEGICENCWAGTYDNAMCHAVNYNDQTCRNLSAKNGSVVLCENWGPYCGLWSSFDNSICVSNRDGHCVGSSFKNGSICYANYVATCWGIGEGYEAYNSSYDDTSCCCGAYCGNAPKCADRGVTCDPKYMK